MWLYTSPNTRHWKYFFFFCVTLTPFQSIKWWEMQRFIPGFSALLPPTGLSAFLCLDYCFFVLNRIWKEEPMNPSTLFFLKPVLSVLVLSLCHMSSRIQLANFSRKGSWNVVGVGLTHTSAGGASLSSNAKPSRLQAFLHIVSYSLFIWVVFCCLHSTAQRQDTSLG